MKTYCIILMLLLSSIFVSAQLPSVRPCEFKVIIETGQGFDEAVDEFFEYFVLAGYEFAIDSAYCVSRPKDLVMNLVTGDVRVSYSLEVHITKKGDVVLIPYCWHTNQNQDGIPAKEVFLVTNDLIPVLKNFSYPFRMVNIPRGRII